MATTLILITLISIGIILITQDRYLNDLMGFFGTILIIISSIILITHLIEVSTAGYDYECSKTQRDAFETTLADARSNGNEYEIAAIVKDVAEWNQWLAKTQYENTVWFFDPYIDDRIDSLKPIK